MHRLLFLIENAEPAQVLAARTLADSISSDCPGQYRIETLDLTETAFPHPKALAPSSRRLQGALHDRFESAPPNAVVCLSPVYLAPLGELRARFPDFVFIASALSAPRPAEAWARADLCLTCDVPPTDGFTPPVQFEPIPFPFVAASLPAPLVAAGSIEDTRPRICCVLPPGGKKAAKLVERLVSHPNWAVTLVFTPGLDPLFDQAIATRAAAAAAVVELFHGGRGDWPELLARHDVVLGPPEADLVAAALASGCPLLSWLEGEPTLLSRRLAAANAGGSASRPREAEEWLRRAFRDEGRLLNLWRHNLAGLRQPEATRATARRIVAMVTAALPASEPRVLRALPDFTAGAPLLPAAPRPPRAAAWSNPKRLLLCDLHTHTTWSDGKLSIRELVDFYGQRGFDCLAVTDHLCDPQRLLGRLVNLTGLVIPPGEVGAYLKAIEAEKARAWAQYGLILLSGIEFNKDGYTSKSSTHLLGVDLKAPINPSLSIKELIAEIQAQGGLAIASHPHELKSEWGRNTLYLWEHVEEYAPLLDAWEVANRDNIFNPIGLRKLPFIASSDFHKPKHIHSWKTVLYCEKDPEAIKHCIRVNRDVSLTLFRDRRFAADATRELPARLTLSAASPAPLPLEERPWAHLMG